MKAYADGGCAANGSPMAVGYGSFQIEGRPIVRLKFDGDVTNNTCEYNTLIAALEDLEVNEIRNAVIKMDSMLVVNQVAGNWKVKEPRLRPLCERAKELLKDTGAKLEWTRREEIVEVLGH